MGLRVESVKGPEVFNITKLGPGETGVVHNVVTSISKRIHIGQALMACRYGNEDRVYYVRLSDGSLFDVREAEAADVWKLKPGSTLEVPA